MCVLGAGEGGYVAEFVRIVWKPLMREIMEKGIRVVTNAGGMDPVALKHAIEKVYYNILEVQIRLGRLVGTRALSRQSLLLCLETI